MLRPVTVEEREVLSTRVSAVRSKIPEAVMVSAPVPPSMPRAMASAVDELFASAD